jgi:K+-transporting ATPase ATPase C chain
VVYAIAQTAFSHQANGSLIVRDGKVIGSEQIAQPFASDKYFSPRPSAAGSGYAGDAASGSNLATTNPVLHDRIALESAKQIARRTFDSDLKGKLERLDGLVAEQKRKSESAVKSKADEDALAKLGDEIAAATTAALDRAIGLGTNAENVVPIDLVTASGSGLDPEMSVAGAAYQAPRVAAARGVSLEAVTALIQEHADESGAILGALPRVNILKLNLDLDKKYPVSEAGLPQR